MTSYKLKVLIVEDDTLQSLMLEKMLKKLDFAICGKADKGQEAIELAKTNKPDLITMDIMLADDIDGIQAAKQIQKDSDADLIYLSGNKDENTLRRVSETRYKKFFCKPFNIKELEYYFREYKALNGMRLV